MCGLAFSGKTTLARAVVRFTGATYVGLDEINRERGVASGGEGLPVEEWERTHHLAIGRVEQLMRERATILVDDTSNLRFLRDRFRAVAEKHDYDVVLVYVDTPLEEIHRRMRENARHGTRARVHPQVFDEHVRTFEHPAEDEHALVFPAGQPVDGWLRIALGSTGATPSSWEP
jgi:predicted kinase